MTALVRFDDVSLAFGDQPILKSAELAIEEGERVCLIGRNGAGKTTVFRLLASEVEPDAGKIEFRGDISLSQLEQALPADLEQTARDYVTGGLAELQRWLNAYHALSEKKLEKAELNELAALERRIESHGGWNISQRVDTVLTDMGLPADAMLNTLSGGWRRRVALARALVSKPDLLLLDEPTNHLDLATIEWLENRVRSFPGSVLFITHDRAFVKRLATRILELDRTRLISWPGSYDDYLRRKEKAEADQQEFNKQFDKRLAEEEAWIRQGIKARRTRNEGRVRALEDMREEYGKRLPREQQVRIQIGEADPSGRKVIRARNVSYGYGDTPVIENLTLQILRGERIGLIGNNGVGKSTLMRLLIGDLEPDSGTMKLGTMLEVGYFDQLRRTLDPERSVADIIGDGRDYITINGRERHVVGYLRGFLFTAKRAMTPIKSLSGGERNRVILARLFSRPTNLLALDEPTNDLDMDTLDVLEERLREYAGTLLVISHDREFLDNVVTSVLVFEEDGEIRRHAGGYSDWAERGRRLKEVDRPDDADKERKADERRERKARAPRKLSYKEKREYDALPEVIEALEREIEELEKKMEAPDFYSKGYGDVQPVLDRVSLANEEHDKATARWLELDDIASRRAE